MTVSDAVTRITGRDPVSLAARPDHVPASEIRARRRRRLGNGRRPAARSAWAQTPRGWVIVRVVRARPSRQLTTGSPGGA
jgi:hypothetical protein